MTGFLLATDFFELPFCVGFFFFVDDSLSYHCPVLMIELVESLLGVTLGPALVEELVVGEDNISNSV